MSRKTEKKSGQSSAGPSNSCRSTSPQDVRVRETCSRRSASGKNGKNRTNLIHGETYLFRKQHLHTVPIAKHLHPPPSQILLRGLQLVPEALSEGLDVPVDVKWGHVGLFQLSVPWSKLGSKPVRLSLL